MSGEQWVCQQCGRVGRFVLMGKGFIMCSGCGTWHLVSASGRINRVGRSTPWLLTFCRNPERQVGQASCGWQVCPGICVRVCHCQQGQERARALLRRQQLVRLGVLPRVRQAWWPPARKG